MAQMTDEELIHRYLKTGDNAPVGELYNRYARLVFGVALKYLKNNDDSRDILFTVFEKLLDDLKKYDIRAFKAWLYTYTKNECLMQLRRNKLKTINTNAGDMVFEDEEEGDPGEKEEVYRVMEEVMESLAEEQKVCLRLFYMEEKSYNEIVSITGLNFNQVKSFIQNGKRNMKIRLAASRHE